jgi:hypothetical protein
MLRLQAYLDHDQLQDARVGILDWKLSAMVALNQYKDAAHAGLHG